MHKHWMRLFFLFAASILLGHVLHAQNLYIQTYGSLEDQPVVFLHGGPGYNSVVFERTTAEALAEAGFFVLVYDRRGEGRSTDPAAAFTFDQSLDDLQTLLDSLEVGDPMLVGHSFGGVLAALYAKRHTQNVHSVVLVGAPVAIQESFRTIQSSAKAIYAAKNDSVNLNYIAMLEGMDTASLPYSSYTLMHAMQNGLYSPEAINEEAQQLYDGFATDSVLQQYASQMTYAAPMGFWKNEAYTTLNLKPVLRALVEMEVPVYGLYGKDDGLYSPEQAKALGALIGPIGFGTWTAAPTTCSSTSRPSSLKPCTTGPNRFRNFRFGRCSLSPQGLDAQKRTDCKTSH
jgi:proline iminopeptidase